MMKKEEEGRSSCCDIDQGGSLAERGMVDLRGIRPSR